MSPNKKFAGFLTRRTESQFSSYSAVAQKFRVFLQHLSPSFKLSLLVILYLFFRFIAYGNRRTSEALCTLFFFPFDTSGSNMRLKLTCLIAIALLAFTPLVPVLCSRTPQLARITQAGAALCLVLSTLAKHLPVQAFLQDRDAPYATLGILLACAIGCFLLSLGLHLCIDYLRSAAQTLAGCLNCFSRSSRTQKAISVLIWMFLEPVHILTLIVTLLYPFFLESLAFFDRYRPSIAAQDKLDQMPGNTWINALQHVPLEIVVASAMTFLASLSNAAVSRHRVAFIALSTAVGGFKLYQTLSIALAQEYGVIPSFTFCSYILLSLYAVPCFLVGICTAYIPLVWSAPTAGGAGGIDTTALLAKGPSVLRMLRFILAMVTYLVVHTVMTLWFAEVSASISQVVLEDIRVLGYSAGDVGGHRYQFVYLIMLVPLVFVLWWGYDVARELMRIIPLLETETPHSKCTVESSVEKVRV